MRIALFIFPLLVANTWANEPAQPVIYDHRILETYPHSTEAFTQGLFFNEGALYESTGNYGQSSLRRVDGRIYANVWPKHALVRIDPESGVVTGVIDLNGLLPESDYVIGKTDVLNGIAYRGEENVLYVTGKNWPKLFKIELVKKPD